VGVDQAWAAAATLPTGCLWLILSLERGVLQGLHAYKPVGYSILIEASNRLVFGLILVGAGADVTGAYLGTPLSMLATAIVLGVVLHRRIGCARGGSEPRTLRALIGDAWAPIAALTLLAVLQNIDVIMVKHQLDEDAAGSYAAAAVAAKALIWVAVGVGLYLLPEAARRMRHGLDARPVLVRGLAIVAALGVPLLIAFAAAPNLVLSIAFGEDLTEADGSLFVLALAFTLLAGAYLAVQYMLALRRVVFLPALAVVAVLEPILLSAASDSISSVAVVVLALQCVAAAGVLALSFWSRVGAPAS
jgi:O-antigen/teichoic acid export membrane protein